MTNETIIWHPRYAIWIALQEDGERQGALAERLGWDAGKLSRLISGKTKKIDVVVLEKIANAQGRPLSWYLEPPERLLPDFVHSLNAVPLSGRTVDYGSLDPTWYERLIPDLPPPITLKAA